MQLNTSWSSMHGLSMGVSANSKAVNAQTEGAISISSEMDPMKFYTRSLRSFAPLRLCARALSFSADQFAITFYSASRKDAKPQRNAKTDPRGRPTKQKISSCQ
jgi:hypothetical protein